MLRIALASVLCGAAVHAAQPYAMVQEETTLVEGQAKVRDTITTEVRSDGSRARKVDRSYLANSLREVTVYVLDRESATTTVLYPDRRIKSVRKGVPLFAGNKCEVSPGVQKEKPQAFAGVSSLHGLEVQVVAWSRSSRFSRMSRESLLATDLDCAEIEARGSFLVRGEYSYQTEITLKDLRLADPPDDLFHLPDQAREVSKSTANADGGKRRREWERAIGFSRPRLPIP